MNSPLVVRRTALAALALLWVASAGAKAGAEQGDAPGRYRPLRGDARDALVRRLESIGYVAGSSAASDAKRGVTVHVDGKPQPGLNFYTSGHAPEAVLMDIDGVELHRWRVEFRDLWPNHPVPDTKPATHFWRRAHLFPNGDVLAIFEGLGLVKLDRNSKVLWARQLGAHHDLVVQPDGDLYVLTRKRHHVPRIRQSAEVVEDFISILDPNGVERRRVSLLEALERSPWWRWWVESEKGSRDLFHTNSIELLDGRLEERGPAFRRGNALVSIWHLDAIAVVDLDKGEVVWAQRGSFDAQHDAKVLPNGNILLFDNGVNAGASRVVELDSADGAQRWQYAGNAEQPFYSESCGAATRLPNGNTLITESDNGRAFEITSAGVIVWEFYNPHRVGEQDELIATLFEVERLREDFPIGWARGAR